MLFCPHCKAIMAPKTTGKTKMVCTSCGYASKEKQDVILKEKKILEPEKQEKIEIIDRKLETDPKTKVECPKCSHDEAYYWLMQTRAADEAETMFFRCVKCQHRWRNYD